MKKLRSFAVAVLGAAAGLLFYCGSFYVKSYLENRQAEQAYDRLRNLCMIQEAAAGEDFDSKTEDLGEQPEKAASPEKTKEKTRKMKARQIEEQQIDESFGICWKELREINSQVVGWVIVPGADISYPVVQGEDDEYYLHHSFSGEEDAFGTIFLGCANTGNFSDSHSLLYGHNMEGNLMFANLNYYAEQEYLVQHPEFYVYTPEKKFKYRIFSVERAGAKSPGFVYGNALGSEEYREQLGAIQDLSLYDTGVVADTYKSVVTLVTCTSRLEEDVRMMIHGTCTDVAAWTEPKE